MVKVNCARYLPAVKHPEYCINFLDQNKAFSYVVVPLFHPGLTRSSQPSQSQKPLSRSCRALESHEWNSSLVGEISRHIDVDSPVPEVRKRSERQLLQELNYAGHLNTSAVMVRLRSSSCENLARLVSRWLQTEPHFSIWVHVPLENPNIEFDTHRSDVRIDQEHESPWDWWNKFRTYSNHLSRIGVVLEVGADLSGESDRARWLGEMVRAICLQTSTFLTNKRGYPVLSAAHQSYVKQFADLGSHVIIAGANKHNDICTYANYMAYLWNLGSTETDNNPWSDFLQNPLQPLMNNLEAQTYEVFEKDPVKYRVYKEAVEEALRDRVPDSEADTTITVIMVMGAGRGPLVQMSLEAAEMAKRKVRVYAVEKNPNAVITLQCRRDEEWLDRDVVVVEGDMRQVQLPQKADILVSELLGSFGDNELSPECLDGAQKFLKDDGISIPSEYTSYICPVMSHKFFSEARSFAPEPGKPQTSTLETTYVVLQKNKAFLDKPQPLFTFHHPNKDVPIDNSRYESKTFSVLRNCTVHGFSGFFHTTLYKSHVLSIVPETFSTGMFSWFPIYMPLMWPVNIEAGGEVVGHFWRCVGERDVWYEWTISTPEPMPIHNLDGRSSKIGL